MTLRIGSLFSGYGGLDIGVQAVLGGEIAWHCQHDPEDRYQYAARILAHHWPTVPNLGDITRVDWQRVLDELGPVDVVTGGFPCTDLSSAGQRLGLMIGTRSGLWHYMLQAVMILRPRLVVIENVRGILSTQARSGVEPCRCCVDYSGGKPVLRALGAVLGDLARIGFDAEWAGVQAAEVGAPHERFREFVLAWPADAGGPGLEGRGLQGAVAECLAAVAHTARLGSEGYGAARGGGPGPAYGDLSAADPGGRRLEGHGELPSGRDTVRAGVRQDVDGRGAAAADPEGVGRGEGRAESAGQLGRSDAAVGGAPDGVRCRTCGCPEIIHDAGGFCAGCSGCTDPELGRPSVAADADSVGPQGQQRYAGQDPERPAATTVGRGPARDFVSATDPAGERHGDTRPAGVGGVPAAAVASGAAAAADGCGRDQDERNVPEGQRHVEWGDYAPAIRRWETILGVAHPWPTDDNGRLAAAFSEWMQGVPGLITSVPPAPGMTEAQLRNARLKAAGNGVVPLQAAVAVQFLLDRVNAETAEAGAVA